MSAIKTCLACCLSLAACCLAPAQDTGANPTPPTDPNQFMRAASEAMSLTSEDMKPWHLKAHYVQTKPDGTKHEGTFEEWWESPEKYKASYITPEFSRTEYRVLNATYAAMNGGTPLQDKFFSTLLIHPLPQPALLDMLTFTAKEVTLAGNKLECYPGAYKEPRQGPAPTMYCFSKPLPVARVIVDGFGTQTTFNEIVRIRGHYVARKIRWTNMQSKYSTSVDLDQIDPELGVDQAALVPPADAVLLPPQKINVSSGVAAGNLIHRENPVYPEAAKKIGVEGTVVLQATISKEGAIENLRAVSGPQLLQQAALDVVKTWRYNPYLLEGKPVEVETTINVVFQLGRSRNPD